MDSIILEKYTANARINNISFDKVEKKIKQFSFGFKVNILSSFIWK